jgi:hypothetical protein
MSLAHISVPPRSKSPFFLLSKNVSNASAFCRCLARPHGATNLSCDFEIALPPASTTYSSSSSASVSLRLLLLPTPLAPFPLVAAARSSLRQYSLTSLLRPTIGYRPAKPASRRMSFLVIVVVVVVQNVPVRRILLDAQLDGRSSLRGGLDERFRPFV